MAAISPPPFQLSRQRGVWSLAFTFAAAVGCSEPAPPVALPPPAPTEPHILVDELGFYPGARRVPSSGGGGAWILPDGPRKAIGAYETWLTSHGCVLRRRVSRPNAFSLEAACAHEKIEVDGALDGVGEGPGSRIEVRVGAGPEIPLDLAGFPLPGGRAYEMVRDPRKVTVSFVVPAGDTGTVLEPARLWLASSGWAPVESVPFAPEGDTIAVFGRENGDRLRLLLRTNATGIPEGVWVVTAELRER